MAPRKGLPRGDPFANRRTMELLLWIGILLTLAGVGVLGWCILAAWKVRGAGLPKAEVTARLQRVVAINLAALGLSALGLMAVIVALLLG